MKEIRSNGKLLITGEYAVLDGALSLALPTKYGQSLKVTSTYSGTLHWQSFDEMGMVWFQASYHLKSFSRITASDTAISGTLMKLLSEAKRLNPSFLSSSDGCAIETRLDFPRNWGLGSSSTLINNIAQWAKVDAYALLRNAFSGSGYDIACAKHNSPLTYKLENSTPWVNQVDFNPPFRERLYFVHLNRKQNSREGIAAYKKQDFDKESVVAQISQITNDVIQCKELSLFESLIDAHESVLAKIMKIPTIKETLFSEYKGSIKSLGAWGGDFILATGDERTPIYFRKKGFATVIPYAQMIFKK